MKYEPLPRFSLPLEFAEAWPARYRRNAFLLGCYLSFQAAYCRYWGDDLVLTSLKDLARELGLVPATVRNLLRELERDGWIRCEWDRGRNQWKITLTGLRQSPPELLSEEEIFGGGGEA